MIGNLVQNQFSSARNWPFGSAASFIVMALVLAAVMLYLRVKDRSARRACHPMKTADSAMAHRDAPGWCTSSCTCPCWCWWSSPSTTPSSRWTGAGSPCNGTSGCWSGPTFCGASRPASSSAGQRRSSRPCLGTLLALALGRQRFRGRRALEGFLYVPIVTPEIVTGISLLLLFALLKFPLGLTTITIAHVAFCISFVVIVVLARHPGNGREPGGGRHDSRAPTRSPPSGR